MSRCLIINADDFGWDEETVASTIELFEQGPLTSATIMTGRPGTLKALRYASDNQHRFSFGLHFNIVDGHAAHDASSGNSLCVSSGKMKESNQQRHDALLWKLRSEDIAAEFRYQCAVLTNAGLRISHIDSHGHLHKFPQVLRAILPVMDELGIHKIRRPQNLYQRGKSWKKRQFDRLCTALIPKHHTTDYFFMLEDAEDTGWFKTFMSSLPEGRTELGVHPGKSDAWRAVESAPLNKGSVFAKVLGAEIALCSWNF